MEKLEFDSLHKFLVSLGLILLVLPFALLYLFLNNDVLLISQEEFNALSTYSLNQLQQQERITTFFLFALPIGFVLSFTIGIILLIIGIKNWRKVQQNLDAVVAADRIKHELDAAQLKNSEILERTIHEVQESDSTETSPTQSKIMKYMDIEDLYFTNCLPLEMKKRYYFRRNIRIGGMTYDGIAISTTDNIDLIYEIKYWKRSQPVQLIYRALTQLYNAGLNYETTKHRNFKCILVIVTSGDNLDSMQKRVDGLREKSLHEFSTVEIKCIAEESLRAI